MAGLVLRGLINEFTLLPQIDVGFRAYIFFASDAEVAACQSSGLKKEMREFLATELQALDSEEDLLALEIDSYENIVRQFEGNYFLRLRSADVQERGKRHL
ncbi:MAG: hypothetical protein IPL62_18495 [Caulobacteraceae bacterium]|nr:hypothetical protein [Caulobacteraceae bacterium]